MADYNNLNILKNDPYLQNFKSDVVLRIESYENKRKEILGNKMKLKSISNFHEYFGFQRSRSGWYFREWAPAADEVILVGDFNNWNTQSHKLKKIDSNPLTQGSWEIHIDGLKTIEHDSRIKVIIVKDGHYHYRVPMFINKVRQEKDEHGNLDFFGIFHNPDKKYKFKNKFKPSKNFRPYIYETHIGIAQEKDGIGTYDEFINILPRIKSLGYNSIQIMAIASHVYYGSFGYHVTNYFAASHWFGDIDSLKKLIDKAHELGLAVFMDIVHSHAAKNVNEGINLYDTTDYQLFHSAGRGHHHVWDSKLFDYGKHDVIKFLLSNLRYYLEEYKFDGFRFDGVTSMLYHNHGIGQDFTSYSDYFSMNTDIDSLSYLTLANELIKEVNPNAVTVAEDVSGYPGLCVPIKDGGVGFDFRYNMGAPELWKKELKKNDYDWDINHIWYELTAKRHDEKTISYAESHDQALVGDKTLMMQLADADLYWNMNIENDSHIIHRAIALHKLIRAATLFTSADGYLNFMGNEFGHPEWIDFPSERNGWSYHYAKRQWHLVDDENLKYQWLNNFDKDIIHFSQKNNLLSQSPTLMMIHNDYKLLIFRRNGLYFVFNFHPSNSYEGLEIPLLEKGKFKVIFNSDESSHGGLARISTDYIYETKDMFGTDYHWSINVYSPSRTMMVIKKID